MKTKKIFLFSYILLTAFIAKAQNKYLEFGIGARNDFFKIIQPESLFKTNFDIGALIHFSFSKKINEKFIWDVGFATNNYKLNFKIKTIENIVFVERETVSIMRSNRLFCNINYIKKINKMLSLSGSLGVSLLVMSKNPYETSLSRSREFVTDKGLESINYNIKTFGLTGSAILLNTTYKLLFNLNDDINFITYAGFITGTGQISKAEVNYALNNSQKYNKAIFVTNGFSPFLSFGIQYKLKDKSK
ncbi:MAG: hypothetical protein HUU47_00475 [Bacteroidetes bacterium]|nr:hypothetical protein [Bacteroidota bacterium]